MKLLTALVAGAAFYTLAYWLARRYSIAWLFVAVALTAALLA